MNYEDRRLNARIKCPLCKKMILFIDTNTRAVYDLHCPVCKYSFIYYWKASRYYKKSLKATAKKTSHVITNRASLVTDFNIYSNKVLERNQQLKENRIPEIIPSAEFHEYFCQVMKEELNKECKCYGIKEELKNE